MSGRYVSTYTMENQRIVVKWTEGRSRGATSVVKRSAIKSGTFAVGEKVTVVWGKGKKKYNAEVVDDGSASVPQEAPRIATAEEEPLLLELANPAPEEAQESPHQDRPPALIQKVDSLVDTVAGLEARGARQYLQLVDVVEQLVARVAQVQSNLHGLAECLLQCMWSVEP